MKSVKFISNPYVRAHWRQIHVEMRDLVNSFANSNTKDLLKKAEEILYPLGWSLEEYQDSNHLSRKKGKRRHNDRTDSRSTN
jgi:hypothetical protein